MPKPFNPDTGRSAAYNATMEEIDRLSRMPRGDEHIEVLCKHLPDLQRSIRRAMRNILAKHAHRRCEVHNPGAVG